MREEMRTVKRTRRMAGRRIVRTPFVVAGRSRRDGAVVRVSKTEAVRLRSMPRNAFSALVKATEKDGPQGKVIWSDGVIVFGLDHLLACRSAGARPIHIGRCRRADESRRDEM